jgi:hypothetical protein
VLLLKQQHEADASITIVKQASDVRMVCKGPVLQAWTRYLHLAVRLWLKLCSFLAAAVLCQCASPSCGVHLKMLNVLGLAQASLCHPSLRVVHMLMHSDGLLLLACVFFVVVLSLLWRGRMCGHADWEWSKSACCCV